MSQYVDLEQALEAMSQDIKFQLVESVNLALEKKARGIAKKINTEVGKYLIYLNQVIPEKDNHKQATRLTQAGGGKPWHKLSKRWEDRKKGEYGVAIPNYFLGITEARRGFGEKPKYDPLKTYLDKFSKVADVAFLGQTVVTSLAEKGFNPPDARLVTFTRHTGKEGSMWMGTNKKGHFSIIQKPSDKDFLQLQLHVMPAIAAVGGMTAPNLEKRIAERMDETKGGKGQTIKLIGRNRQILAPLLRWMYRSKIAKILRESDK